MQKQTDRQGELRALVVAGIVALALVAGLGFLAWRSMQEVSPDAARAWALVATALLPVAGVIGFRLAHAEAKGRLRGIDDGLEKVIGAASKAIDLKVVNITKTKEATQQQPTMVVLPPPEPTFTIRPQLEAGEVIELE